MRCNFLVLHEIDRFDTALNTHVNHIKCFERYSQVDHNYLYHRLTDPVTDSLRKTSFHVVVLDTTALSVCRYIQPREIYSHLRKRWAFLGDLDAIKIAFPQDDYHRTNEVDALLDEWGVDVIYTVLPKHAELMYPRSGRRASLKPALTGYVDDDSIRYSRRYAKAFERREFDIGQRVKRHPAFGGRHSLQKSDMADRFAELGRVRGGFRINISSRPEDVLAGDDWLKLLGNSRFALGCEGGVSVWDPDGIYHERSMEYMRTAPAATFKEVEAACFPGEDGRHVFSAVSPRLFESTMMGCSQVLIEGEYLGLLKPWEHFIPVRPDLGNVEAALEAMEDVEAAKRRANACYEDLIENPALRYSSLVRGVLEEVERSAAGRGFRETGRTRFNRTVAEHRSELSRVHSSPLAWPVTGIAPPPRSGWIRRPSGVDRRTVSGRRRSPGAAPSGGAEEGGMERAHRRLRGAFRTAGGLQLDSAGREPGHGGRRTPPAHAPVAAVPPVHR